VFLTQVEAAYLAELVQGEIEALSESNPEAAGRLGELVKKLQNVKRQGSKGIAIN